MVPNIGIEIKTNELKSIQLDVFSSFWDSFDGKPYQSLKSFWSTTGIKKKTLFGLHVGFGMFTLQKPRWPVIYDQFQDPSTYNTNTDAFQSGRVAFYGVRVGYKKLLGDRI